MKAENTGLEFEIETAELLNDVVFAFERLWGMSEGKAWEALYEFLLYADEEQQIKHFLEVTRAI